MEGFEGLISPGWVQAGEIGLAFMVVLLATWLVVYVLKTSGDREKRYVEIINGFLPLMQSIADRLEDIETAVGVDRKKRRESKGLFTSDH